MQLGRPNSILAVVWVSGVWRFKVVLRSSALASARDSVDEVLFGFSLLAASTPSSFPELPDPLKERLAATTFHNSQFGRSKQYLFWDVSLTGGRFNYMRALVTQLACNLRAASLGHVAACSKIASPGFIFKDRMNHKI